MCWNYNQHRREKWLHCTRRADLPSNMTAEEAKRRGYMICEDHFRQKDILFKVGILTMTNATNACTNFYLSQVCKQCMNTGVAQQTHIVGH